MDFNPEVLQVVASTLQEKFGFATQTMLDKAVADVIKKTQERQTKNQFSMSTFIRGLRAMRGEAINTHTAEADVAYCKTLTTGTTPGSYLVPTIQADEIIAYLNLGGIARASGLRVWPMQGIQNLNVPTALAAPTWLWAAQGSALTPTDPNLGQMQFNLKERRCLVAVPNQLIAVSVPAFDTMLSQLIGLGAAEHEDQSFFNTTTLTGGPTAVYAASGTSVLNVGGSANGGNIAFSDILAVLAKSVAVKAKPPFCWFFSPRTFFQRVLGLLDSQSRPLTIPTLTEGLYAQSQYKLMGWPVYVTPYLLENESIGSGSNQAHGIFTNPQYMHIAQDANIEIAFSLERYFDASETAIRAVQHEDFGYAPPQGIVVLAGIN